MAFKKPYYLKRIDETYLAIGLSHERMDAYIGDISVVLQKDHFSGRIVFDLLLSNGNNSRRFFVADVSNGFIDLKTIKKTTTVDLETKQAVLEFFAKHKRLLTNGILTSNEIVRIKEQIESEVPLQPA